MLRTCIRNGLLAVVILAPVSLIIVMKSGMWITFYRKLPFIEPVLWVLFLVWIGGARRGRDEQPVRFPPLSVCAFLLVVGLSAIAARGFFTSCREFIQHFDYFCIAYILFLNMCYGERDLALVSNALLILAGVVILYGVVQFVIFHREPHLVSSLLDDRNVLGAFLAILLPVLYGVLLREKRIALAVLFLLLAVVGILINTALVSLVVLLVALVLMHLFGRSRIGWRSTVVFGAIIAALFVRIDAKSWRDLFFEPGTVEEYHRVLERNIGMMTRKEWYARELTGERRLLFSSSAAMPEYGSELYYAFLENELRARSRDTFVTVDRAPVRQRFLEWQAALYVLEGDPLLGVGPGNYQRFIGHHYRTFPRLNTLEPSTQNGYLVIASSMGFLGLSCFVWMLGALLRAAWIGLRTAGSDNEQGTALGLFGALTSFCMVNLFYNASDNHATLFLFVLVAVLITARHGKKSYT